MVGILIRQLDDETKSKLRLRAARNGHSMEQEARDILQNSLASEGASSLDLVDAIRRRVEPLGGINLPLIPRDRVPEPLWKSPAGILAGQGKIVGDIVNFDTSELWDALRRD